MAITATMAEAQNDYYKAMRAGKREGEILPNLDDILSLSGRFLLDWFRSLLN